MADGAQIGFDPEALKARYRAERDARLRPEGNDQYVEVAGDFAHYLDDPYVEPGFTRAPVDETVEALVIGGGFGALLAGARLLEAGVKDLRIVEKGGDFGGTWYWNRYPGAQCDIDAYIYLPLLEETGYVPSQKYVFAWEIREHTRRIANHYGFYDRALFQTQILEMRWEEADAHWRVTTDRGDVIRARYVLSSSGPLNRPKLPGVPGIDTFKGHTFHTSRWDYAYTGGDERGNLTNLADKRVAVIGTGATAIQCVPFLGQYAQQLYVFQRTPSSVDRRGNSPTDPQWKASLKPGWQRERMDNFNALVHGVAQGEDMVHDGWTEIFQFLTGRIAGLDPAAMTPEELAQRIELADHQKMNEIRARVDSIVKDKATAEALKPWYRQFCKRPTFNDDYLPTFNRPNVRLVDTRGRGVERITEKGLVFDGVEYEVDCIIYATGFEVGTDYSRRSGFNIVGREGRTLADYWADGYRTLHGFYSHGFPNLFHLGVTQNALPPNYPHLLHEQTIHVADLIRQANDRQARALEPTAAAEQAWVDTIASFRETSAQFRLDCTPGYYNAEGRKGEVGFFDNLYGPGAVEYLKLVRDWREQGDFEGLAFA
jgi:cation diffusion facilitator CzcD-associated flavoprotein CzcO